MEKVEYRDVNRFLVSIGLILISLSLLLPYLYLREDFGLYLEKDKIDSFSPTIQDSINNKVIIVEGIQNNLIPLSVLLLVIGIAFLSIGLVRWFKRQKKIDEKEDLDIKKLKLEIEILSPEEQREKAEEEADQSLYFEYRNEQNKAGQRNTREEVVASYLAVEKKVIQLFKDHKSNHYHVLDNIRIAGRYAIDILLEAKNCELYDRIVEVKYINKSIDYSTVDAAIKQLGQYAHFYAKFYSKNVIPVLLFVYSDDADVSDKKLVMLIDKIKSFLDIVSSKTMKRLQVQFVKESELGLFDAGTILKN